MEDVMKFVRKCSCQPGYYLSYNNGTYTCTQSNGTVSYIQNSTSQNDCPDNQTFGSYFDQTQNQVYYICGALIHQQNSDYEPQQQSTCNYSTNLTFSSLFGTCYTPQTLIQDNQDLQAAINLCNEGNIQGCFYIMNQCGSNNTQACNIQESNNFQYYNNKTINAITWGQKYKIYNESDIAKWKNIINIRAVITNEYGVPIKSFLYDPEHFNLCRFYQTGNIQQSTQFIPNLNRQKYGSYKIAEMLRRSGKEYTATGFSNGYPSQYGNNYINSCLYDPRIVNQTENYYISFFTDNIDENYQFGIQSDLRTLLSIPLIRQQTNLTFNQVSTIKNLQFSYTGFYDSSIQSPEISVEYNNFTNIIETNEDVIFIDNTRTTLIRRFFNLFNTENYLETTVKINYQLTNQEQNFDNAYLFIYCIIFVLITICQEFIPKIQLFIGTEQILTQQMMILFFYLVEKVLYALANASWRYQVTVFICYLIDQQGTLKLFNNYQQSLELSSQFMLIYGIFLVLQNICKVLGTYFKSLNIFLPYRLQAINHSTNYSERNLIYRNFYQLMVGNQQNIYIIIILSLCILYASGLQYYNHYSNNNINIQETDDKALISASISFIVYIVNLGYMILNKIYIIYTGKNPFQLFLDLCHLNNTDFIFFDSQQSAIFVKGEKNYIQQTTSDMSQQVISESVGKKQPRGIQGIQQFRLITSQQDQIINDYYTTLQTIYIHERDAGNILSPTSSQRFMLPSLTPSFGQQQENRMIQLDQQQDDVIETIQRKFITYKLKHFHFIPKYAELIADTQLCGSQQANISSRNYQPNSFGLPGFFGQFSFDYIQYLLLFIGFFAQFQVVGCILSIFLIVFSIFNYKLSWKRLICQQGCIHDSLLE